MTAALPAFRDTTSREAYDAIVVGSGPNGLAAAIRLAQAGLSVVVIEAAPTVGGGMRSQELTLPGFVHDVCSAVHPFAVVSPYFQSLPLADYGLEWLHPDAPLAHPLDDGAAVVLERAVQTTAAQLGTDRGAYERLFQPLVDQAPTLFREALAPLRVPRHPLLMARFGLRAMRSAAGLARHAFQTHQARALFAGNAAHAILPLEQRITAAVGLMLLISGHAAGWPVAKGGSQRIAHALSAYFLTLGGEIVCGCPVQTLDDLPSAKVVLCDVSPAVLSRIAATRLPASYKARLGRYRYGPGAFKVDWALSQPIPWKAPACNRASTVHVGGTLEEIAVSERACWRGEHAEKPFVLVSQQSRFDPTRAPGGQHTGWAYCHVPHGSTVDMTEHIIAQIERFAPGFRDCILATHTYATHELEAYNANYIGGDIIGGVQDLRQLFTRPVARLNPYTTPAKGLFICSSSTPPGAGVHGMCGYFAAEAALRAV